MQSTKTPEQFSRATEIQRRILPLIVAFLVASLNGCESQENGSGSEEHTTKKEQISSAPATVSTSTTSSQRILDLKDRCQYFHKGLVLDLGAENAQSRRMFELAPEEPARLIERAGESFRTLDQPNTDFTFWVEEKIEEFQLQALIHGLESERVAAYLNGKRLGAAKLKEGETRVIRISGRGLQLEKGRHRLTLSLSRPRGGQPRGAVSWVRLGDLGTKNKDHPFTERQSFTEVTVAGVRHPSFIAQPGGKLRCPVWIPADSKLTTRIGLWGQGVGESEIAIITTDGGRFVLESDRRTDEDSRDWKAAEADLRQFASQWVTLEFVSHSKSSAARTAFAQPLISTPQSTPEGLPRARRAIVFVLSGLGRSHRPPHSAKQGVPFFNQLAEVAAIYPNYRVSTSSATGAIASLLSGLPPWKHGIHDSSTALPRDIPTLASAIEANGGRSSFFTGVPTSFEDFGFDRGFELFSSTGPQEDKSALEPLKAAREWLTAALPHDGPVLSVIHLRGAHPPFDLSKDEARKLAPEEYGGDISPRRAAIQLSHIRSRRLERHRRMPEEDWKRLEELQKAALLKQSEALRDFVQWLRKESAYEDTLLVVMGDVGAGARPKIPFSEEGSLDEDYLAAPLLVKYPGGRLSKTHVKGYFAPRDLTMTLARSLNVPFDAKSGGIDLEAKNATFDAQIRPHIAFRHQSYSLRNAATLLRGDNRHVPIFCKPELDPACSQDRSIQNLGEARALWFTAWSELGPALSGDRNEQSVQENQTLENALIVWGHHR